MSDGRNHTEGEIDDASASGGVTCPHCGSDDTTLEQRTGSALCRMLYSCEDCGEPFELFG